MAADLGIRAEGLRRGADVRRRGIHPMVYFRGFVGKDTTGTDDPKYYDEAVSKGYVATHADGSPYVFT